MFDKVIHNRWARIGVAVLGTLLSAVAINLFITPQNLYASGVLGMCQVIRTLLARVGITASFDLAGVLYLIVNIPLIVLAWKTLGRKFVILMMICVASNSLFVAIVPIPATPIIDDKLTSCMLGGILNGFAGGLILTCGGSTGGLDTIGMYLSQKGKGTVGKFALVFNAVLYAVCAALFSLPVALYSAIYSVLCSVFVDRLHQQNIAVQVLIFTRENSDELKKYIVNKVGRGVTYWTGYGGFTDKPVQVLCVCLNKYEIASLRQAMAEIDPHAFVIVDEGVSTTGNFERHLA